MDHHMYHHHDHDQYQHQMTNPYNTIITTQPPPTTTMDSTTMIMDDEKKIVTTTMTSTRPQEPRNCPRCNSSNTKFCYYNNYSLAQPRYLCKSCRRYWTEGGSLRNVPVGGGSRKNKKVPLLLPNSSSSSTSTSKNLPDLNPPFVFTSSSNPSKTLQNNNDLSLSFSSPSKQGQGHYGHFTDGQNSLFQASMGMIQFVQEYDHHGHNNNKTNLGFSLDKEEIDRNTHQETVWNKHSRRSPEGIFPSGLQHQELKTLDNANQNNFTFNGGGITKMMYPYGDHDEHNQHEERHDDGNKRESGSSNELWSGIILGGDHSGGPTW